MIKHQLYYFAFLTIINLKVIFKEVLYFFDFSKTEILNILELIEIIVVCKNKNFLFAIFSVIILNLNILIIVKSYIE